MARSNIFVVGELLRRASDEGGLITIRLQLAEAKNRARSEPRYFLHVRSESFDALGFVAVDDERGYPLPMRFADVGAWIAKYLSAEECAVMIEISDASLVGVGFKGVRLDKQTAKFQALDVAPIAAAALSKQESVSTWFASARKQAVMAAAENMLKSVLLINWLKDAENLPAPEAEAEPGADY